MLRLLKLLVLPLVAVSMVSGICSLQRSGGEAVGRLARLTFAYYAGERSRRSVGVVALGAVGVLGSN